MNETSCRLNSMSALHCYMCQPFCSDHQELCGGTWANSTLKQQPSHKLSLKCVLQCVPCISCHKTTTHLLSSVEMNNGAATPVGLRLKIDQVVSLLGTWWTFFHCSLTKPSLFSFILSPLSCQADSCVCVCVQWGEGGTFNYIHVLCLYICVRSRCLFLLYPEAARMRSIR